MFNSHKTTDAILLGSCLRGNRYDTHVLRTWTNELAGFILLDRVTDPAHRPANGKQGERGARWKPEHTAERGECEIDVWCFANGGCSRVGEIHDKRQLGR